MKKVLYITYDGLADPLGQSQILPYIKGLSSKELQFTILSFEKEKSLKLYVQEIDKSLDPLRINNETLEQIAIQQGYTVEELKKILGDRLYINKFNSK